MLYASRLKNKEEDKMEEKFFCLVSGIEGPSGLPMLNPKFFPFGKIHWGKIIAAAVFFGGIVIAVAVKMAGIF